MIAGKISNKPHLQMAMPGYVLKNDDIHGQCISDGGFWPKVKNKGCNFTIEEKRTVVEQDTNELHCTDFVIKNVTATCEYMCAFSKSQVTKLLL